MNEYIEKFKQTILSDKKSCSMNFIKGNNLVEFRFRAIPDSKRFQLREMVSGNRVAMTYTWSREQVVREFENEIKKYI